MKILSKLHKLGLLLVLALLLVYLPGCDKKEEEGYDIYYKDSKNQELATYKYQTDTTKTVALAKEFIEQLKTPDDKVKGKSLFDEGVIVEKVEFKKPVLNVYFNNAYNDMASDREVFLRAGLVKTLTQIEDVSYIQLYVDGAVAQYSDGTVMGLLDASDFVDDSAAGMDSIQWREIQLFFANERGDKLVSYSEEIAYNKNSSVEKLVVEKIIKGPADKNMQATVPSSIKLLDISVNDRVCYVNLDASFMTEMVNVSADVPVYSIVNSLCSLPGIDSVKILINGNTPKPYRDTVKLDQNLRFNYEIVDYETTNKKIAK